MHSVTAAYHKIPYFGGSSESNRQIQAGQQANRQFRGLNHTLTQHRVSPEPNPKPSRKSRWPKRLITDPQGKIKDRFKPTLFTMLFPIAGTLGLVLKKGTLAQRRAAFWTGVSGVLMVLGWGDYLTREISLVHPVTRLLTGEYNQFQNKKNPNDLRLKLYLMGMNEFEMPIQ